MPRQGFDRTKHKALWKSLEHNGINPAYVELLKRLDSPQGGTVLTDKESDVFPIKRGTKQGDPMSSLLFFNTVLQCSLEEDLKKWEEKPKGIRFERQKRRLLDEPRPKRESACHVGQKEAVWAACREWKQNCWVTWWLTSRCMQMQDGQGCDRKEYSVSKAGSAAQQWWQSALQNQHENLRAHAVE